ncbi:MAG: type II methionyl aminopeptidase [Candidatus Diapherotrites archaeon]|nr:type II methionyl aminopeptidase [Candidatus Diapherotrites archaeon]
MDEKEAENYALAGKILQKVVQKAKKSIEPGQKLLEIAQNIEKSIEELGKELGAPKKGAKPAFPVNLSINENAAHYTPDFEDETALKESDVIKVDVGVHIDGYIADTAFTLNFDNKHAKMIEAAEEALSNALALAKEGASVGKIGAEIEKTIKAKGFNPIQNLSGHGLKRWEQHAPPSIPNNERKDERKLEDGNAYAIEPFATNGEGWVRESQQAGIFALEEPRQVRNQYAREVLGFIAEEYQTLPFAERWLQEKLEMSDFQRKIALRELLKSGCIRAFPVLREAPGKIVAQAEKSILFHKGKITEIC